ncbi:MAG: hypothetical protein B7O98_07820 [Zestosphaera tikiterensis]|uniref:Uncharacterized protein n=1 Tax=Zestosphaera tikiterensis TaxID=1973259 RepID=A0A2R7Y4S1_9CREN|nr:MAG: hypothetical protein B7O98_07820 [Zestosphaera tikiterensis]
MNISGRFLRVLIVVFVLSAVFSSVVYTATYSSRGKAVVIELTSTIDGGAVELVRRGVNEALRDGALVILYIDTYGGYLSAADSIVKLVKDSGLEVYSYVPPGGKAVSAGSLIALSSVKIFMSPASVIGAAEPSPSDEKTLNYVRGRFRSLAEEIFKGNETLIKVAESFVTENRVLTYDEAVKLGFAEPVANFEELRVRLGVAEVTYVRQSLWESFISLFSSPVVSSLALTVGVLLIFVELLQAGFQGYAIAGVLLIILSLYAMSIIPVNLLFLLVMLSGMVLLLVEIFTPGFGAFGITGIILMGVSAYELIRSEPFGIPSSTPLVIALGLSMLAGLMLYVGYEAGKVRRIKQKPLRDRLVGSEGIAKTKITPTESGVVHVLGEDWTAFSVGPTIEPNEKVKVVDVKGLILYVDKAISPSM